MRWPIIGPGRVGAPVLDEGDAVALADRHGCPLGEWVTIVGDCPAVRLRVPLDAASRGPVKCYLVRDTAGRIAWWSEATWHPAAMPGQWVHLPLRREWPHILPAGYGHDGDVAVPERARDAQPDRARPGRRPRPSPPPGRPFTVPAAPGPIVRWSSP